MMYVSKYVCSNIDVRGTCVKDNLRQLLIDIHVCKYVCM